MKKVLYCTTALVAAAVIASPASAAEKIKLGLGGYHEQWVGYSDPEEDPGTEYRAVDVKVDAEVYFNGSTTLDNGIRVAVMMQLEAGVNEENNPGFDESYIDVSSDTLGLLRIGGDDVVTELTSIGSPDVGMGTGSDIRDWLPTRGITRYSDNYVAGNSADEQKISYFTPNVAGFQASATYIPEVGVNSTQKQNTTNGRGHAWAGALTYGGTFGGVGLKLQTGYYHETGQSSGNPTTGLRGVQGGASVSYAGFTVSGGYERSIQKRDSTPAGDSIDGYTWDAGIKYETGPYAVSFVHKYYTTEGGMATEGQDEAKIYQLSGKYNLGPGVDLKGSLFWADYEDETKVDANYSDGGWGIVAGVVLSF